MTNNKRVIYVYAHWVPSDNPVLMGVLYSEFLRGKEIFSFEYENHWLTANQAQILDPDLRLYNGIQYLNDQQKGNFGLFLDSSPDRWGRILMRRREAALSRIEKRPEKNLHETDYLLGVYDLQRMGALRFKEDVKGDFLNNQMEFATPPWTFIRELEEISLKLENDDVLDDPHYLKWLSMLIAPGSSLGGARPKASVLDTNNHLWIAKFPSKNDDFDMGAWEAVCYQLALDAGVNMAPSQAKKFSSNYHTFLSKRFDRTANGSRIHFASAMTMLGYTDGSSYTDGVSYLELAEFLIKNGANTQQDLHQLWKRIVFNICVSNTDDHLRNHGFILTPNGWILSPAYDINPIETGTGLKLNINENNNALEIDLAMEVIAHFRLTEKKAMQIIQEVQDSVANWQSIAKKYGISKLEQEMKSKAFR